VTSADVVNKRYSKLEISNRDRNQLILENILLENESCSRIGMIGISPIKILLEDDIPDMSSKFGTMYPISIMQFTILA
jgi:hypothetical protein